MKWIWRDIEENMWLGDKSLNDPTDLFKYKLRWKINNKPASISEKRAEWIAVRVMHLDLKVDEDFFKDLTLLYITELN